MEGGLGCGGGGKLGEGDGFPRDGCWGLKGSRVAVRACVLLWFATQCLECDGYGLW